MTAKILLQVKKEQSECATVKGVKKECVKSKLLLEDTTGRQYQDCFGLLDVAGDAA